ncbi:hypothetical protein HG535_0G03880 [Zygotorulaspora mrakii]|uniref:Peptidase A1 domain-containing protein n=1 Tax=Zygotorulaspora mrakii TaxID=42260 RepID=A0A7H9B702_ZYGMR|nr:uncharacterized protein HG535_0G03880 [Zygotorulaspora mrakii]QLG74505.1 hypothetical protein HG535_0G03880 [Zygotorulaspora mrakii]
MKFGSSSLACAAILAGAQAGVITKREDDNIDSNVGYLQIGFEKFHGHEFDTAVKNKRYSDIIAKRDNGAYSVDLLNRNTYYAANVEIGSSRQRVVALVDTGSSDFWVMGSSLCSSAGRDDSNIFRSNSAVGTASQTASGGSATATADCRTYGSFDPSNSSTWRENSTSFYVHYADTSAASGPWGTDTIDFGSFSLENASIGVANFSNASIGGILGVGLAATESTFSGIGLLSSQQTPYQYENVPAMMVSQGLIHKNAYSLFLNSIDADTGSILFGAVDHSKYSGQLYTLPILRLYGSPSQPVAMGFDITVQGVGITDGSTYETITSSSFPALLDSGTTLMYVPYTLSDLIAREIGATYSRNQGYYLMDCPSDDDTTQLVFDFGGLQINTNLSNYVIQASSTSNVCYLGIIPTSNVLAIFGDVFLRDAYVVYDLDDLEISLAQANFNNDEQNIDVITSDVPSATRAPGYSNTLTSANSITGGGNIFTLSGATATGSGRASGVLSRGSQTTGSTAGGRGISSILPVTGGSSVTISTSQRSSSDRRNIGERAVPASWLFVVSSFIFSFFL